MQVYRDAFKPSALLAQALGNIGVFVICAETEEKARYLAASRDLWRLRRDRGQRDLVPTEEEALSYTYTPAELMHVRSAEHKSELQSLMRISYALFCLKKKKKRKNNAIHCTN